MNILVVDDDRAVCSAVRDFLLNAGYEVSCVLDAESGVEIAKREFFDLVFLDYKMPDKDGEWFLRNAALPRRTKVILLTAHLDREIVNIMFKLGICGYVMKPFGRDDLLRHLSFHLEPRNNTAHPGMLGTQSLSPT